MTTAELDEIKSKYQPYAGIPSADTIIRLVAEIERIRAGIKKVIREGEKC